MVPPQKKLGRVTLKLYTERKKSKEGFEVTNLGINLAASHTEGRSLNDYSNPYREQMIEVRLVFSVKARKCFATKHVPLRRYCYTSETNKPGFKGKLTWSSKIHSLVS